MQQWEYKKLDGKNGELALNEIGEDGWEMCGVVQSTASFVTLYFKREKLQEKRNETLDVQSVRDQMSDGQKDNLTKVKPKKQEEHENKDSGYRK